MRRGCSPATLCSQECASGKGLLPPLQDKHTAKRPMLPVLATMLTCTLLLDPVLTVARPLRSGQRLLSITVLSASAPCLEGQGSHYCPHQSSLERLLLPVVQALWRMACLSGSCQRSAPRNGDSCCHQWARMQLVQFHPEADPLLLSRF